MFARLRQRQKVKRLIRRLFPGPRRQGAERRTETRPMRICPVLLAPESEGQPVTAKAQFALTSDVTSGGLAVITDELIHGELVYVGFQDADVPNLFLAARRSSAPLGGGFHRVGLEFVQVADQDAPGLNMLRMLTAELSLRGPRQEEQDAHAARTALFDELRDMGLPMLQEPVGACGGEDTLL
jgi:hypothetical protein